MLASAPVRLALAFSGDPSYSANAYQKTLEAMQARNLKHPDTRWR